jgi:molybdopterin/thiamine biosynthesis adenylyltransferase
MSRRVTGDVAVGSGRYSRQELFAGLGPEGQARLRRARVLVVGVGALGSALAEMMARAGVGALTVVDRDFVEESNLQRQSLFEEQDAEAGLPKAVAAEAKLRRINGGVAVRGLVADVSADNVLGFVSESDLVLDGTDNFETRFLVNDACLKTRVPWIYGACVGSYGLALAVRPSVSPCLRCIVRDRPAPGSGETCDTVGVVAPIVHVVAGVQAAEALKLLGGREEDLLPGLVTVDLWSGLFEVMDLRAQKPSCPACLEGRYESLDEVARESVLCGRDAVQLRATAGPVDLDALANRLSAVGRVVANEWLVRFFGTGAELVVFRDGRVLVKGVADVARARSLSARYLGF